MQAGDKAAASMTAQLLKRAGRLGMPTQTSHLRCASSVCLPRAFAQSSLQPVLG